MIVTRKEAKEQGLKTYYTGKACPQGHVSNRTTINGQCVTCKEIVTKSWRSQNKQYMRDYGILYYNKTRTPELAEKGRLRSIKHYEANKSIYKEAAYARKKKLRQRQLGNIEDIREFYKNCPEGYHVDHVIPITHDLVCGLHCVDNFQYLPAAINLAKGNSFTPG